MLFPINWETLEQTNDFLYIIIEKILNRKENKKRDEKINQLKCGITLTEKPSGWDSLNSFHKKNDWFTTKTNSDLVHVVSLTGYYLWTRATNFCQVICPMLEEKQPFENMDELMEMCKKAVKPVIIEMDVSEETAIRLRMFLLVSVSDEIINNIKGEKVKTFRGKSKKTIYEIKNEYEDLAWLCLHHGNFDAFHDVFLSETCERVDVSPPTMTSGDFEVMPTKALSLTAGIYYFFFKSP